MQLRRHRLAAFRRHPACRSSIWTIGRQRESAFVYRSRCCLGRLSPLIKVGKELRGASQIAEGNMHPPLTLHKHPSCAQIILDFKKCHEDHPVQKFLGACNDLKIKLDRCFREEKAEKRKANFETSKQFKEKLWASKSAKAASKSASPAQQQ